MTKSDDLSQHMSNHECVKVAEYTVPIGTSPVLFLLMGKSLRSLPDPIACIKLWRLAMHMEPAAFFLSRVMFWSNIPSRFHYLQRGSGMVRFFRSNHVIIFNSVPWKEHLSSSIFFRLRVPMFYLEHRL